MDSSPAQFFTVMNTKSQSGFLDSLTALLSQSVVQSILGMLIVLMISYVAYNAVVKLRESTSKDTELGDEIKKNFEEMRSGGDISEAEYRKISASLEEAKKLSTETNAPKL